MKRIVLLVLALTAAAYAVLFVYCGTALGLPLHAVDLTLHLVLLAGILWSFCWQSVGYASVCSSEFCRRFGGVRVVVCRSMSTTD